MGTCTGCGREIDRQQPHSFVIDFDIGYPVDVVSASRYTPTARRAYCEACMAGAPPSRTNEYHFLNDEQAAIMSPIYERYGLGSVKGGDKVPG